MDSLIRDLLRASKQLRLRLEAALAEVGGSFAMFAVLDAVAIEPGLSQRAIGDRLSIEGPSITRHLDHLEAEGLVTRQRDREDRRIIHITLTATGQARYEALCPIVHQHECDLLAPYSPDEAALLRRFLGHIHRTAGAEAAPVAVGDEQG
jgi:MarR family transcriptional regulator, transcriptional regulator for hemolysin